MHDDYDTLISALGIAQGDVILSRYQLLTFSYLNGGAPLGGTLRVTLVTPGTSSPSEVTLRRVLVDDVLGFAHGGNGVIARERAGDSSWCFRAYSVDIDGDRLPLFVCRRIELANGVEARGWGERMTDLQRGARPLSVEQPVVHRIEYSSSSAPSGHNLDLYVSESARPQRRAAHFRCEDVVLADVFQLQRTSNELRLVDERYRQWEHAAPYGIWFAKSGELRERLGTAASCEVRRLEPGPL